MSKPQPAPRIQVTGFRPRPDDSRRVANLLDVFGGNPTFIFRVALAYLDRRVQETLAAEGPEAVQFMLQADKLAVLDPALRQKPGPKVGGRRRPRRRVAKGPLAEASPSAR